MSPEARFMTVGEAMAGRAAITASSRSAGTLSLSRTWPRARRAPCSRTTMSSMAARLAGSSYAVRLASSSVRLVSSVAMIFRPALRSEEPVSVRSTIASTMSGILASVAPWLVKTLALTPCSSRKRRVVSGISVEMRTPSGRSATDSHGDSFGTASTTLTTASPARPPPISPRLTTSAPVSVTQSRPLMPRSKMPCST